MLFKFFLEGIDLINKQNWKRLVGYLGTSMALNHTILSGEWSCCKIILKSNIKIEMRLLSLRKWITILEE